MKLAVTGLGAVSPIGIGREALFAALGDEDRAAETAFAGESTVLSPETFPGARVAEVWGWDPAAWLGAKGHRNFDRLTKFLIAAAKLALEDAGLKRDGEHVVLRPEDVGICSATAYGSLDAITEMFKITELEDPRYINPTRFPNTVINAAAGYVSIWEDLRAPNTTLVNGNCGSLDAILVAATHLARHRGAAFLAGGGEVLMEPLYLALRRLGLAGSLGIGEGAAYVVLERDDDARARGAHVQGVIRGYGSAFEAPEREGQLVHASAGAVTRAIRAALDDAELAASDVDLVLSSAGGLEAFDRPEREGIAAVFGDHVALRSPKRVFGETFGAAGAFGLATALAALASPDDRPRNVVVHSLGFYGNASAVVLSA